MSFMEPELTKKIKWVKVDDPKNGITYIQGIFFEEEIFPKDVQIFLDFDQSEGTEISLVEGYGVRLSAPGYIDCTEWEVFSLEREAKKRFRELVEESA